MIDIHTHILPYCDDGAETMEDSINELIQLSQNGVSDAVLTPHYIRNIFDNTRNSNLEMIITLKQKLLEREINIKIHQGAEVYLDDNIWEDIEKYQLFISNTKYVLVETCFTGFPGNILDILYQLVKRGFRPILAHPERYYDIVTKNSMAEDLIYRNVYLQLNAGSFLGYYGNQVQETAWRLLKNKLFHFIASDTHCNSENYVLNKALVEIAKHTDNEFVKIVSQINPQKLLNNIEIEFLSG